MPSIPVFKCEGPLKITNWVLFWSFFEGHILCWNVFFHLAFKSNLLKIRLLMILLALPTLLKVEQKVNIT